MTKGNNCSAVMKVQDLLQKVQVIVCSFESFCETITTDAVLRDVIKFPANL